MGERPLTLLGVGGLFGDPCVPKTKRTWHAEGLPPAYNEPEGAGTYDLHDVMMAGKSSNLKEWQARAIIKYHG